MRSFLKKYGKDILLTLAGATVYIVSVAKFGSGITDDSVNYLSAANSLPDHLLKTDGSLYIEWPPLYPIILSLFKVTGLSAAGFATLLHGIVFVFNLLLTGKLLQPVLKSGYLYFIAMTILVFSIPLLQSHVFIWSEPVFILLLLLNLSVMLQYLKTDQLKYFVALTFLSMLMSLQRKTGLYFTITFGMILVLLSPNKTLIKRGLYSFIYFSLSITPFVLWTWRKYKIAGRVFESAYFKEERLTGNFLELLNTLSSWILPNAIPLGLRMVLILLPVLCILYLFRSHWNTKSLFNPLLTKVSFISFAGYLTLLPITFIYIQGETMDDRILSPVYIIGLMWVFLMMDAFLYQIPDPSIAKKGIFIALTFSLCYPVMRTISHIKKWNTDGPGGYNSTNLIHSTMIGWLKENETNMPIQTNNPYLVNYYLNYSTKQQRIVMNAGGPTQDSCLLVSFNPPLNKDRDFNYIGDGKTLFKDQEGTVILIKK